MTSVVTQVTESTNQERDPSCKQNAESPTWKASKYQPRPRKLDFNNTQRRYLLRRALSGPGTSRCQHVAPSPRQLSEYLSIGVLPFSRFTN